MTIRSATPDDAEAIAAIHNQGIAERAATFDTEPRRVADVIARLRDHPSHPLLVATVDGRVVGWAGMSSYRPRACYAGVAECSVYLDRDARGQGIGKQLLGALIDAAAERGFWKLVSRIFLFNHASRAVCKAAGFREVGVYEKHAPLAGRWLDVVIVERLIPSNIPSEDAAVTSTVAQPRKTS